MMVISNLKFKILQYMLFTAAIKWLISDIYYLIYERIVCCYYKSVQLTIS